MTYKRIQTQLIMNHSQYQWLMHQLNRVSNCAKVLQTRLLNDSKLKPDNQSYNAFYQHFLYEAALYQLNERERECVKQYVEALWKAHIYASPMPKFVYRNLVEKDFSYHQVDMRSFLTSSIAQKKYKGLMASTIYSFNNQWYIYLYVKVFENHRNAYK